MFLIAYPNLTADAPASVILLAIGGPVLLIFSISFVGIGLLTGRQARRLMAGEGLMEHWQVSPADWDRFVAIDQRWRDGGGRNLYRPKPRPADAGAADVYCGDTGMVIDGQWVGLSSIARYATGHVAWLPTTPSCIEFAVVVRGENTDSLGTFRLPVPSDARDAAERVFAFWNAKIDAAEREEFRRYWRYNPDRAAA
jgi:hypothetical protein